MNLAMDLIREALLGGEGGGGGGGGGDTPLPHKAVNFIDVDGTVLYSYDKAEFMALSAMPELPTRDNLTVTSWNWSLADAKAQMAISPIMYIGPQYASADGKTRLYIHLQPGGTKHFFFYYSTITAGDTLVEWGDGTTDTLSGYHGGSYFVHDYTEYGDYVIAISNSGGKMGMSFSSSSSSYNLLGTKTRNPNKSLLTRFELAPNISSGQKYVLLSEQALNSVVLDPTQTEPGQYFMTCSTSYGGKSPKSVVIPDGYTSISNAAFSGLWGLSYVSLPKTVTAIGDDAFGAHTGLLSIALPDGLQTIGKSAFSNSDGLYEVTIPATVTSIGNSAFNGSAVKEVHMKGSTPPTLGTNVFYNNPTGRKIYVPTGSLADYQAADNWSSYASDMVEE